MKNKFAKCIPVSFAAVALLITVAIQPSIHAQDKGESTESLDQSVSRIVGAWETTVMPRNCETGEQVGPSFNGLITFNAGGTLAEYGANPATPFRTPGHGIWSANGGRGDYSMRFSFMPLTPAGVPVGRLRVSQVIQLNRFTDESYSSGSFVLTNLAGTVIASGCSTSTAVRLN